MNVLLFPLTHTPPSKRPQVSDHVHGQTGQRMPLLERPCLPGRSRAYVVYKDQPQVYNSCRDKSTKFHRKGVAIIKNPRKGGSVRSFNPAFLPQDHPYHRMSYSFGGVRTAKCHSGVSRMDTLHDRTEKGEIASSGKERPPRNDTCQHDVIASPRCSAGGVAISPFVGTAYLRYAAQPSGKERPPRNDTCQHHVIASPR
jgi:hypothetical protein